jgi:hypothetical protein
MYPVSLRGVNEIIRAYEYLVLAALKDDPDIAVWQRRGGQIVEKHSISVKHCS